MAAWLLAWLGWAAWAWLVGWLVGWLVAPVAPFAPFALVAGQAERPGVATRCLYHRMQQKGLPSY
jgi:hypothetical protein